MKTKNLYPLLVIILSTVFTTSNATTEIEQYLDFGKATPSQFSVTSIKYYFYNLHSPTRSIYEDSSTLKSKTDVFNQSLSNYIKEMYNGKHYASYLSQDGTHIIEFLELSNERNLHIEALYTYLRLIKNKYFECELIDDTVAIQILEPLPFLLEKYFEEEEYETPSQNFLNKGIEKILLYKFTDHLQEFQKQPNDFLTNLSIEISKTAKQEIDMLTQSVEKKEMVARLRQTVVRLLETILSRIIWNQTAYESIWESVLSISNSLQLLGVHGILDHMDDLDDLLWVLTHRFSYFLDLAGSSLPVAFYEEVECDLASKVVCFLEAQEQDDGIKSKKQVLIEALTKAKAKALAFEKRGIFTDQML